MAQETEERCECCEVLTWVWTEVDETVFCMKCVGTMVSEITCKVCGGGSGAFARGGGPDDVDIFCKMCLFSTSWVLAEKDAEDRAKTKKKKQKK